MFLKMPFICTLSHLLQLQTKKKSVILKCKNKRHIMKLLSLYLRCTILTATPEVKQLGHEADHSLPLSVEVKNASSYTFTSPIHLHGVVLT